MVRVAQISFHADTQDRTPAQLLQAWPTLTMQAESAAAAGARVRVIQACGHERRLRLNGIDYAFQPFHTDPARLAALLDGVDVLHVQGLHFVREVLVLARLAPGRPVLLQDHAGRAPRHPWAWPAWRRAFAASRGLIFNSREQAAPFRRRGLIPARTRVYEVPESSSHFRPLERALARRETGLHGAPALLWVGHLDPNKDPLAVLDALALAAPQLPGAQLWCCFGSAPQMSQVQARLCDPRLAGRVHLLGSVPHERVQTLMAAADLFVQGSHREGSGYSLIEALACGLPPVVTDIPSFRTLAGDIGNFWRVGDAAQLAAKLVALTAAPPSRAAVRGRFEQHCSPAALGRQLLRTYEDALRP